jgi:hypothetical protein
MDTNKLAGLIESLPGTDLIIEAARYQDSSGAALSPDFEFIDNGDEAALCWFDSDAVAAQNFIPFAQSHDGGLFAFWNCKTKSPIVYLASECEGTRVIARTTFELLSIVAFGSDDYALDIAYTDQGEEWSGPEYIPESLSHFRDWLKTELKIMPTDSPLNAIKESMAQSPDLMDWIRAWQNRKYGQEAN